MAWMTRFGKRQGERQQPKKNLVQVMHIIVGILCMLLLCACIAFFPLLVLFVPKPQLTEYMPEGIKCATCVEMWYHNRDLFNRGDMLCYGPPTLNRPTRKEKEVMYTEEKRCWALQKGHDEWMRPVQVTSDETENWDKTAKAIVMRGGQWP